jgi:hypothetical protein
MLRKITALLFLLGSIAVDAQFQKGTLLFKNNTLKEGYIKTRSHDGIKFKENEEDKPIIYSHLQVIGFDIAETKYRYVKRNASDVEPVILKEMIHGTIVLYEKEFQGGETLMEFGPGTNLPPVIVHLESSITYYMLKDEKLIKIGKKIKNRHLKMLKDCPDLISKIKKEEIHRENVITSIEYYNEHCGKTPITEEE